MKTGDISNIKNAQEELKLFSRAVEEAADGIQIVDLDGHIIYSNRAIEKIYGLSHEEYKGKHVNEMNADQEFASKVILPSVENDGQWAGELKVKHKDGHEFPIWLSTSMVKDKKGKPIAMVSIISDITEHKRAREELKRSKEFVETILNSMDDAISIIDVSDFKIVEANRVFNDLYDINGDEAIGKHCYEVTHQRKDPCAPPDDMCPLTETLKTGKFAAFDHIHTRHDGKKEFVEVSASPIKDDDGKVVQVVHIARNITGRKQSEQQIKNIIDAAPDVIHVISPEMKIITRNAGSKKLFPHIKEGDYCHEALHKREMVCAHCGVTKVFKDGEKQEHESTIKLPNGKKITVYSTSSPIFDENGNVMAAVEILRDITKRKQAEQQLKDIINAAPDVIHLISPEMKIITRNAASKKLFPHIKEGDFCHEALHKRDEVCAHCGVTEVFKDGKKHEHESSIALPDGSTIIVYSTSSPIFDESGNVISAVEILRDITKRKKTEEVMWKYAKDLESANQLKDLFTDIMRHDLLNHLGIIRNLAELVLEDNELDDLQDIQMMMSSARKLEEIVDSASTYAKLESAEHIEWKEMDLNTLIKAAEDALQPYFEEKHISLEHKPKGRYTVNTISMVEEVFVNLLSNAVKYSDENTKVTVDIEDAGENWRVTVADQGAGVPDEYKEKIFNRLTRRKKQGVKGSGIGLAIVKRIADLHMGSAGVLDNPSGGSIFYFDIPKKEK